MFSLKKKLCLFILLILTSSSLLRGDDLEDADNAKIQQLVHEPLFVSLGSYCEVTHILRACGIRKAAFPFDWITTLDSEKFLEILDDDFCYFLDEDYLRVGDRGPGPLLNAYYLLEFLHEGDFRGNGYVPNMEKLQAKYQRRIQRFRSLSEYPGKVYFLRTAYIYSTTDPNRYYYCADNLEITDEYAWRLYHSLKHLFPQLDFTLIIINNWEEKEICEEKRLEENLIKIRSNPNLDLTTKSESFIKFIQSNL